MKQNAGPILSRLRRFSPGLLALLFSLSACDTAGPVVTEIAVVSDTNFTEGPYEVEAVLLDNAAIASVDLLYQGVGLAEISPMEAISKADAQGIRFFGSIAGQPIGTTVRFGVRACDEFGNCSLHPADYPEDAETFLVGKLPSDPHVLNISPDFGPTSGGTRVEIFGQDFRDQAVVRFGGIEAVHVEWIRSTLLVAITPPHLPGVVNVAVENPDGVVDIVEQAFTFFPAPEVLAVIPELGPSTGGTDVEVIGAFFPEDVRVFFDHVPCRHLVRNSAESLSCVTPPGRPGLVDVSAEHEELGFGVLENGYRYVPPPVIDGVTPDRGPDQGGTEIVITGEFFDEDVIVLVGGTTCLDLVVVDEETLICTTPPGDPGAMDVEVINPDGQNGVLIGGFNYLGPPVIVQVVPDLGPLFGGGEVRILGAGFSQNMLVLFDDQQAEILDVIDDIELVVLLPASVMPLVPAPDTGLAAVDVSVVNLDPADGRSDVLFDGFTYFWPPEVFSVDPPSGPTRGGTEVLIRGRFFRNVPNGEFFVTFGDANVEAFTVLSTTSISATTPAGPPGFVDVSVENFPESIGVLVDGFEYIPPPIVDHVEPDTGPTFGQERVRIVGEFFQQGAQVFFGDNACTDVVFVSSTELECTTPAGEEGFVDVTVINPDGQLDTAQRAYEYVGVVVLPDFGLPVGYTRVRILGAGIQPGAVIRFGNIIASECQVVSNNEVICQTPATNTTGPVNVSFTNPDGTSDDAEAAFTYRQFIDESNARIGDIDDDVTYVAVADLDADGDQDIVAATNLDPFTGEFVPDALFLNDGAGDFSERLELPRTPLLYSSHKVTLGDVDGDELPDLVFAHTNDSDGFALTSGAHIYRNLGGGEFSSVNLPGVTAFGAFDAQLFNLVGDERQDLVVFIIGCRPGDGTDLDCTDDATGRDLVFEQTAPGVFNYRPNVIPHDFNFTHDHRVEAVDLDGDGDLDMVVNADTVSFPDPTFDDNRHRVFYNRLNENLGFEEVNSPFVNAVGEVFGIDSGDVDGNGTPDIVMPNCVQPFGNSEMLFINQAGMLSQDVTAIPGHPGDCDFGVHLFDADKDGDLDVVYTGDREGNFNVKVYINRGNGTFVDASQWVERFFGRPARGIGVRSGDLDADGDPDLVVAGMNLGIGGALRVLILQ
ncbi:MAG: hypothetical protein GY822_31295 [Deltaproteobacteria bacterium]|nr:hypothetical protein [Deltaproteobacteria bacterium]